MTRIVIVEDEAVAARRLAKLVESINLELVGICGSMAELEEYLSKNKEPDLFLMDIHLSDGIIFEFLQNTQLVAPIIFTTAFDQYAIKAFKQKSIDYLLKPIDIEELKAAIKKYEDLGFTSKQLDLEQLKELISPEKKFRSRVKVQIGNHIKTIMVSEIALFFSESKITFCSYEGRAYPLEGSLSQFADELSSDQFFRVSRNCIVNIDYIENVIRFSGSRLQVVIREVKEREVIVARERVNAFKDWLG